MSGILLASVGNSYGSLPVNIVAPAISGSVTVGSTLTTSNGTWTGAPTPTFAYQWQKGTTNISGATSSTFVVQLNQVGSTIRCVVTATNPLGSVSANSANTATVPQPIGLSTDGGFYAGQISTAGNGVASHYLIVCPKSSGETLGAWKGSNTDTAGTSSVIDGPTNSSNMNNASHPAAQFCEGLSVGGFSDWYMPAKNELEVCYYNLKPTTFNNNTSSGTNTNAVPSRGSNYTISDPGQTSAATFLVSTGAERYESGLYWSSTQANAAQASAQAFGNGTQVNYAKTNYNLRVRAVRRVAV